MKASEAVQEIKEVLDMLLSDESMLEEIDTILSKYFDR